MDEKMCKGGTSHSDSEEKRIDNAGGKRRQQKRKTKTLPHFARDRIDRLPPQRRNRPYRAHVEHLFLTPITPRISSAGIEAFSLTLEEERS